MPGISLKCELNKKIKPVDNEKDKIFINALNSIIHNEFYKREILLNDDLYSVGCTRYQEYPVNIFENSEYWVCLEGKIYGKEHSVLTNEIYELMSFIFGTRSDTSGDKKIISNWLSRTDGEFVIYALNKKSKDFIIMNDVLGRLPIYYFCIEGRELLVSREMQFISCLIQESDDNYVNTDKFDGMGIAQFLLFCHTLGKRTLLKNIYRLEPATLLRVYNDNSEIKIENLYRYNFGNKTNTNDSLKKSAQELQHHLEVEKFLC